MKIFPNTVATFEEDDKRAEIKTNRGNEYKVTVYTLYHTYAPHKGRFHDEWTYSKTHTARSENDALNYAANALQ
jgi:hypothetical protein